MKKSIMVTVSLLLMFVFTAAVKTPKQTVSSLSKQLKTANETIEQLEAQKVSLTAKVAALEKEIESVRKHADNRFMTAVYGGCGVIVLAAVIIFMLAGKSGGNADKKAPAGMATREDHFADMETHVLDDWHNILFHPERINMTLYNDLNNHFPGLHADIEEWKREMIDRDRLVDAFRTAIGKTYPSIEVAQKIYLLTDTESEPFIEDNSITDGGSLCAKAKEGINVPRSQMQEFMETALKMMAGDEFSDIKKKTSRIRQLKDIIDVEIRKIKHNRKLPGNCEIAR